MKIAINRTVINKPDTSQVKAMTYTFENVDITPTQLADHVNRGYAFCAQHKNKERKSGNFTASDFLAVDIDDGMKLGDALNDEFVLNYSSFVYTTPNHTDEFPRFRIVFALGRTITARDEMRDAYLGIIKKFGGDPSCKDPCRQFFGSKGGVVKVFDNTLPEAVQDKIIQLGKESRKSNDSKASGPADRSTIRSRITVDQDTAVTTKGGEECRLADLQPGVQIHCPIHVDRKASAFTVRSRSGVLGVHCSTCCTTYFTSADMPLYDFNYSLDNLKSLGTTTYQDGVLTYKEDAVVWLNEQYIPPLKLDSHYIFVKSPKGSGKTQWLEQVVADCKKKKLSVLLIGHRQSLISSVARRLGLISYIKPSADGLGVDSINNKPSKYYAICADSLPKLLIPGQDEYDVVLIDEAEQVFSHLTDNTVKERRNEVFLYFKHFVRNASAVYVMDADLNRLTVEALADFGSANGSSIKFIVNDYRPTGRSLDLYDNENHLKRELLASLDRKERCFVCSNSKKKIDRLEKALKDHFGTSLKTLTITSDNSSTETAQAFIRDIASQILEYDVVLVSPSVGTGVDITFPNAESHIDCVYGFFEARVNTHFDIDQQISRVRHPKAIKVWISPERFRFEHDPEIIKNEVRLSRGSSRRLIGIQDDGRLEFEDDWSSEYLDLYSNVLSMRRGSKNNLVYHFRKMKEHYGWTVNEVEVDVDAVKTGIELEKRGLQLQKDERAAQILSAKLITASEYSVLDHVSANLTLTDEQKYAMRRYEIESFYYQPICEELIELDDQGRFRHSVREYENYISSDSDLKHKDMVEETPDRHFTDAKARLLRKRLIYKLLLSAGLADSDNYVLKEVPIRGESLGEFVQCFKSNRDRIARYFDIDMRRDIDKKPVQQLRMVLKLLGISWTRQVKKELGTKIYEYRITDDDVSTVHSVAARRMDKRIASEWHEQRNQTSENRLFNPEIYDTYAEIRDQLYLQ
jgi:hypothetical protein